MTAEEMLRKLTEELNRLKSRGNAEPKFIAGIDYSITMVSNWIAQANKYLETLEKYGRCPRCEHKVGTAPDLYICDNCGLFDYYTGVYLGR